MKRRRFNIANVMRRKRMKLAAVVWGVLCLATVAAWGSSYWYRTTLALYLPSLARSISGGFSANSGQFLLIVHRHRNAPDTPRRFIFENSPADPSIRRAADWVSTGGYCRDFLGLGFCYMKQGNLTRYVASVPFWFIALSLILPVAWSLRTRRRRRRRMAMGCCQSCGYDLRATPERCPECGTLPQRLATTR